MALMLVQPASRRQLAAITAEGLAMAGNLKVAAIQWVGIRLDAQPRAGLFPQLPGQVLQPLFHRSSSRPRLTGVFIAAAPTDQQMTPRGHQRFQQHITVLITPARVAQPAALLQQMEPRPLIHTGEHPVVETHQHDHLVRNRPHRLQRTHRERTTAMPEAATVHRQGLRQHLSRHRHLELQRAGGCPLLPFRQGRRPTLTLPAPGTAISEEILQQGLQQLHPGRRGPWSSQLLQPAHQPIQNTPPTHQPLRIEIPMKRGRPAGCQAIPLRQRQTQQPTIQAPTEAVGLITAPLPGIEPPAEARALQAAGQGRRLSATETLLRLQGGIGQQPFQPSGGQAT